MINSMTGFGRAQGNIDNGSFTVEIKTVNHRFIDFSLRLPRALNEHENRIKELIKERLNRGYVSYQLSWDKQSDENGGRLVLNEEKIRRYQELFEQMNRQYGIPGAVGAETFSRLPDVFRTESESGGAEQLLPLVEEATRRALEALVEMRRREGEVLRLDILARLEKMESLMDQAQLRGPERVARLEQRLKDRVRAALEGEVVDQARLMTEITIYADKWDFSEEDVRFRSHLEAMRRDLIEGGPVGRKLSFLTQELNREANTVASKANDAPIAQLMVGVKEEIEKVREQVENIE